MTKRSEADLEHHLHQVEHCGRDFAAAVNQLGTATFITREVFSCGSRFCPRCAAKRRSEVLAKMQFFAHQKFLVKLELTFADNAPDPYENPEYYSEAWENFVKRVKRRFKHVKYFRVVELTKAGRPHYHILMNVFIPHRWISETFPQTGGGSVNWIKQVNPSVAFHYVTKYITKDAANPSDETARFFFLSGMRQYSYSHGIIYRPARRHNTYYLVTWARNEIILADTLTYYGGPPRYDTLGKPGEPPKIYCSLGELTELYREAGSFDVSEIISAIFLNRFEPVPENNTLPVIRK